MNLHCFGVSSSLADVFFEAHFCALFAQNRLTHCSSHSRRLHHMTFVDVVENFVQNYHLERSRFKMFSLKIAKRLTSTATSRRLLSDTAAYPQFASGQSLDKLYSQKSTNTVVDSLTVLVCFLTIQPYLTRILLQSFENGNFTGYIPVKKLDISYCTSSGPGGQNVNRLYTKATVKLNLASADWIPDEVKTRIQDLVCF